MYVYAIHVLFSFNDIHFTCRLTVRYYQLRIFRNGLSLVVLRNQSSNVEIKFIPRTDANVLMIYKQRNILCNKEVIQEIQKDKK